MMIMMMMMMCVSVVDGYVTANYKALTYAAKDDLQQSYRKMNSCISIPLIHGEMVESECKNSIILSSYMLTPHMPMKTDTDAIYESVDPMRVVFRRSYEDSSDPCQHGRIELNALDGMDVVQLQQTIEESDHLLQTIEEPDQLQQTIEESDHLQQTIEEPDHLLQTIEEPDHLQQTIEESDKLQQTIEEPDHLQQTIEEPDHLLQTIEESDQLQQTIEVSDQLQQTIEEPDHLLQTIEESDQLQQTIEVSDQLQQTIEEPDHLQQTVEEPDHLLQTIEEPDHLQQTIEESDHLQQTIEEPDHLLQTNQDVTQLSTIEQSSQGNNTFVDVTSEAKHQIQSHLHFSPSEIICMDAAYLSIECGLRLEYADHASTSANNHHIIDRNSIMGLNGMKSKVLFHPLSLNKDDGANHNSNCSLQPSSTHCIQVKPYSFKNVVLEQYEADLVMEQGKCLTTFLNIVLLDIIC